ncbi:hypothetical protein [Flavobacterium sp. LC2016-01]|uniref:hypothetical protein n=1 Tax=Flavobacterium sp. LC2016-01 TaxID=2675876 RepID=UPI0012BA6E48|nr:hypothetical protein [Flavobacterium sp. LC2016-01]MTH15343.1 hypothetical protein [Flavobacterium sp. LC2016-01]
MKIPEEIIIQITDKLGYDNSIENVVFGFRIFESEDDYYTTSYFKTDSNGSITIKQTDLINKSELKWENDIENFQSLKTEVFVLDANSTKSVRASSKNYINIITNKENLEKHLKQSGFNDENIIAALQAINNSANEQMEIYNLFKDSKNDIVEILTEKIEDIWKDNTSRLYKFIITKDQIIQS